MKSCDSEFSLDIIDVATPCSAEWATMKGDQRVRHCEQCDLNVYNLSELTEKQARRLILEHNGDLCVRLYRRADGTVITRNCPVGLRALRRTFRRTTALVAALLVALLLAPVFALSGETRRRFRSPLHRFKRWSQPPAQAAPVAGQFTQPVQAPPIVQGKMMMPRQASTGAGPRG